MLRLDRRQLSIALITAIIAALVRVGLSIAQGGDAANIISPANGTTIDGKITIQGTATHSNFRHYKVEYALVGNPWMLVDGRLHYNQVNSGDLAAWDTTAVPDGNYELRLNLVDNTDTSITAKVGIIISNKAAAMEYARPHRGCPACHKLVDSKTGRRTLTYEANKRLRGRGSEHPKEALDGTSLEPTNDKVRVTTCLLCHASGNGARAGQGAAAPLALRDIVHPVHMFSARFVEHYKGNCFSCHNVAGNGSFELLTEEVEVNEKGIPNPVKLPIPGAIPIGK